MTPLAGRGGERGATAVLVVGVFLVLLLFVGMSVDFGIVLRYRRAMQNACDAGALAGGLDLRRNPSAAASTAIRYAENDMRQNYIAWDPSRLTAETLDDNNQPTLIGPRRVRVEIHADVPTYFFRLIRDLVHVAVDCTARLTNIILTEGLVPMGMNYAAWSDYYASDCWAYVTAGIPLDQRPPHCRSFDITLGISANSTNPWGPGNTGLLSMSCFDCPAGGGAQWLDYFINGSPTPFCYDTTQSPAVTDFAIDGEPCANVRTQTGVALGPIRSGVRERCSYPAPPDSLRRIIMMPLLNPAYIEGGQGTYTTEIWGFVAFQIDCTNTRLTGSAPTIRGGFVSIVSMQAYGRETAFDTGVYTIKLVE